jgi:predicted enzyme related to lactoylglutathione lyase
MAIYKRDTRAIEYYRIDTNGISGGLLKRPAKIPPMESGTNAYVCSVQVDNFDKTSALILSKGGRIALPKFAIPGRCWQGYFLDADNNTFGIFQPDANAK